MHQSIGRSGHAKKIEKGNHRRMSKQACLNHGAAGNTCSTPTDFSSGAIKNVKPDDRYHYYLNSSVHATLFLFKNSF